jgi:hypothetical protein
MGLDGFLSYVKKKYPHIVDDHEFGMLQMAVKKYALSIKDIKGPSIEVCKIALERNPYVIEFISTDLINKYNLFAS